MSLIAELQRRSVFKVGIAYLVVAWLVIQVAATVAPQMGLPEWAPRFVTLIVMLGFPVALVLAWVFDVTPEGLKADPAPVGNKRVYAVAVVLAASALGWYYRADLPIGQGAAPATALNPRLAVLPLANFSPDPANAFFADGLHDDLLTALSRMKGVEVVSRTTMQTFKDSKKKLADIASEVGATQVLEGSVRRDATRVRLTVQLIDARNDDHIWAETYDRPLADALTLQNEVAQGVAKAMKVAIAGGADDAPPTAVPAAYDLYLKSQLTTSYPDALSLLDSALLLDPGFTLARAARAATACRVLWSDGTRRAELAPKARADIEQARRERPDLLEIGIAEGYYTYYVDLDYAGALRAVDAVLARAPDHPLGLALRAFLLRRLDRHAEALAAAERVVSLDPANPNAIGTLAEYFSDGRRYREAIATLRDARVKFPRDGRIESDLAIAGYALTGDREAYARAIVEMATWDTPRSIYDLRWTLNWPSTEWIKANVIPSTEWQPFGDRVVIPIAHDLAWAADFTGDKAAREKYLAQADAMFKTLDADAAARPQMRIALAQHRILEGERDAGVADIERVLAENPNAKDSTAYPYLLLSAANGFAQAGAKSRALDMIEGIHALPYGGEAPDVVLRNSPLLQRVLGDEPRFMAFVAAVDAKFETL